MKKNIPLFWWSEIKFTFKKKENYGDLLSRYIVEKISGKQVEWVHPKKQPWYKWDKLNYLAVGSIIHHATKDSIVWGSGIIDRKQKIADADFRAVRGPRTRDSLLKLGYECPEVYGDPALLLPLYFNPQTEKKFQMGVIPHYHDYWSAREMFEENPDILVIDLMTMDVEKVTKQIMSCEKTISSSLHGLIVSHTYKIHSVWVEFSDKLFGDGVKFADYFESVGLPVYAPPFLKKVEPPQNLHEIFDNLPALPQMDKIKKLQNGLIETCPFV